LFTNHAEWTMTENADWLTIQIEPRQAGMDIRQQAFVW